MLFRSVKELAASAGMEVPAADPRAAERAERANSLYDVMTAAANWFTEQLGSIGGAEARAYLEQRGLNTATIKDFGIGFAPDARGKLRSALAKFGDDALIEAGLLISVEEKEPYDRFRGRLMIPIRDPRGRVIAFGGRILGAGEPKYLNSPDTPLFDKGRTLYNLDRAGAAARKSGRVIVVEGYMDVIAIAQQSNDGSLDDVVAPLGTALTETQMETLWRFSDTPLLCFDGDKAGQKAALRAAHKALPILIPGKSLNFVQLPNGQDPDDIIRRYGISRFQEFLNAPETLESHLWRHELEAGSLETPELRAGLRARLSELAKSIKNSNLSNEYQRSFNNLFFERFRFRKDQRDSIRSAMAQARGTSHRKIRDIDDIIFRAVLLGLMRYSDVLVRKREEIQSLIIRDRYLAEWRHHLIQAAIDNQHLDEDLIDTILSATDVSPIEKRDIRRDLAFSFFKRGDERARDDLTEVIGVCLAEQGMKSALASAQARFVATHNHEDWSEQQRLQLEIHELSEKRKDWADSLKEAA